ncbi:hypothetical protein IWQ60_003756 [Tieghemiomyces parasiticus]|uniref:Uncharacterized protein n=1 Tax=Tieghemiomyces parasiticus TaxID=78921 RepID=A0A9W8AHB9_9FUNG|nr:hypothetical protein IWQ60_003756 [Tieghemiomyces parasiticus]
MSPPSVLAESVRSTAIPYTRPYPSGYPCDSPRTVILTAELIKAVGQFCERRTAAYQHHEPFPVADAICIGYVDPDAEPSADVLVINRLDPGRLDESAGPGLSRRLPTFTMDGDQTIELFISRAHRATSHWPAITQQLAKRYRTRPAVAGGLPFVIMASVDPTGPPRLHLEIRGLIPCYTFSPEPRPAYHPRNLTTFLRRLRAAGPSMVDRRYGPLTLIGGTNHVTLATDWERSVGPQCEHGLWFTGAESTNDAALQTACLTALGRWGPVYSVDSDGVAPFESLGLPVLLVDADLSRHNDGNGDKDEDDSGEAAAATVRAYYLKVAINSMEYRVVGAVCIAEQVERLAAAEVTPMKRKPDAPDWCRDRRVVLAPVDEAVLQSPARVTPTVDLAVAAQRQEPYIPTVPIWASQLAEKEAGPDSDLEFFAADGEPRRPTFTIPETLPPTFTGANDSVLDMTYLPRADPSTALTTQPTTLPLALNPAPTADRPASDRIIIEQQETIIQLLKEQITLLHRQLENRDADHPPPPSRPTVHSLGHSTQTAAMGTPSRSIKRTFYRINERQEAPWQDSICAHSVPGRPMLTDPSHSDHGEAPACPTVGSPPPPRDGPSSPPPPQRPLTSVPRLSSTAAVRPPAFRDWMAGRDVVVEAYEETEYITHHQHPPPHPSPPPPSPPPPAPPVIQPPPPRHYYHPSYQDRRSQHHEVGYQTGPSVESGRPPAPSYTIETAGVTQRVYRRQSYFYQRPAETPPVDTTPGSTATAATRSSQRLSNPSIHDPVALLMSQVNDALATTPSGDRRAPSPTSLAPIRPDPAGNLVSHRRSVAPYESNSRASLFAAAAVPSANHQVSRPVPDHIAPLAEHLAQLTPVTRKHFEKIRNKSP